MMKEVLNSHRSLSKVDKEELADILYRGRDRFRYIKNIMNLLVEYGGGVNHLTPEASRVVAYEMVQKTSYNFRMRSMISIFEEEKPADEMFVSSNWQQPGSVGLLMGANVIKNTATDEQVKDWYPKLMNCEWHACYAQTELGTGSDVQNLKTLAVFDPKTQEFEFHSPSIESIKWWPGDLGLSSSHAIVFARLISNGVDHGVQSFFIQLRDTETHVPLKGIEVGDIGPKLGYITKDNGFLRFTRYRTNKYCLIGRYISIDDQGNVTKKGNPRRMYTAMMKTRTALLTMVYSTIFKAITIATRYSLYRTQFLDSKQKPIPIYNYQMQREKLFKEISRAYLINFATTIVLDQVSLANKLALNDDFSELQSTHVILCSFKAMFTNWQSDSISNLIKVCGGHGYSYYSGLPHILTEEFANQILEGENTVLLLQVARHLTKTWFQLKSNKPVQLSGFFSFIKDTEDILDSTIKVSSDVKDIVSLFKRATCFLTNKVCLAMMSHSSEEKDMKKIWDTKVSNQCQRLARVFSVQVILEAGLSRFDSLKQGPTRDAIYRLFQIAAFNLADEYASALLESGGVTAEHIEYYLQQKDILLDRLKDDGLVLAEGMQWNDELMGSAIGSSDKEPYETLYKWAKELGTLNRFDNQIHPAVIEHQLKLSKERRTQKL